MEYSEKSRLMVCSHDAICMIRLICTIMQEMIYESVNLKEFVRN